MRNPKVDAFLRAAEKWRNEMAALREVLLGCGLTEDLKWSKPCYAFAGHNLAIIQPFKEYCALLFFKGALLKNTHGALIKTGRNTEVGRQIRFTGVREIQEREAILKAHIREAIAVEKAGLKVITKKISELAIPKELQGKLDGNPAFKTAFAALTPGRQKAYIFYFSGAKQSETRASRVEKHMGQILKGRGLNDR